MAFGDLIDYLRQLGLREDAMHAVRWLHKRVADALPTIHRARLKSVFCGVAGLLSGQQLSLTGVRIGRTNAPFGNSMEYCEVVK